LSVTSPPLPSAPRPSASTLPNPPRASTGIAGLDEILGGGLPTNHLYLLDGEPGSGKTTLALQFLLAGAGVGARGLYVTLSESRVELEGVAASHGWSLDADRRLRARPTTAARRRRATRCSTGRDRAAADDGRGAGRRRAHGATLVVLDSLSEMRLLARDPLRFRRQILSIKQYFAARACTVLLLDDKTAPEGDLQLHSLAHGVIALEHVAQDYGDERRRLQVSKLRGLRFRGGYPRLPHPHRRARGLPPPAQRPARAARRTPRAVERVARDGPLLGGGLQAGTSRSSTGPAGSGKSVLRGAVRLRRGSARRAVRLFIFDERLQHLPPARPGLGLDLRGPIADGTLGLQQVEPTELSPGEFATSDARGRGRRRCACRDRLDQRLPAVDARRAAAAHPGHELLSLPGASKA
jgi:circadian clock protein KaiC